MEDQLITFDTAKLAKEKGFNEHCYSAYTSEEDDITDCNSEIILQKCIDYTGEEYFTKDDIQAAIDNGFSRTCLAPTQSLLQRWLREKHNIVVDVFQDSKNCSYTGFWKVDISVLGKYQEDEMPTTPILKRDFEEALEKGLQEALKLIK